MADFVARIVLSLLQNSNNSLSSLFFKFLNDKILLPTMLQALFQKKKKKVSSEIWKKNSSDCQNWTRPLLIILFVLVQMLKTTTLFLPLIQYFIA